LRLAIPPASGVPLSLAGGLAPLIGEHSKYIKEVDDLLTLDGLRIIWERNAATHKTKTQNP